MKLRTKLVLSFLSVAAIVLLTGLLSFRTSYLFEENFERVARETAPTLYALNEIQAQATRLREEAISTALLIAYGMEGEEEEETVVSVKEGESAEQEEDGHGGDNAGKESEEEEMQEAWGNIQTVLAYYSSMAKDSLEQELSTQIKTSSREIYIECVALIAESQKNSAARKIRTQKKKLERAEDAFLAVIQRAIAEERKELLEYQEETVAQAHLNTMVNAISPLLAISLSFFFGIQLSYSIANPISRLKDAALLVARGEFPGPLKTRSRDEIDVLTGAFNQMVDNLKSTGTQLTQKNSHLQDELRQRRTAEIELEKQRAMTMHSDRLRSLGEMAAGIAHELNQPLTGVRGLAEHAIIGFEKGWKLDEGKLRGQLQKIVEQADRMVHIIQHVRTFARTNDRLELQVVEINGMVQSALSLLATQFRSRGLKLEIALADDLPPVQANKFSLEEVLFNLLSNARYAAEHRDKTDGAQGQIKVSTGISGDGWVEISVEDNGVGIPPETLTKIFEPFFTTKEPNEGTGLGLSISQSIIEEAGGNLDVRSCLGEGSTFLIRLEPGQHAAIETTGKGA